MVDCKLSTARIRAPKCPAWSGKLVFSLIFFGTPVAVKALSKNCARPAMLVAERQQTGAVMKEDAI